MDSVGALKALLAEQRRSLEQAELHLAELDRQHRRDPSDLAESAVEVVYGIDAHDRMVELHRRATDQIRSFEMPPYAKKLEHADTAGARDGLSRGLRHRILYSRAAVEVQGVAMLTACLDAGEEARVTGDVPIRLSIYDDSAATLPVTTGQPITDGLMVVRPGGMLDALVALFEMVWARSLPLGLERSTDPETTDNVDDEVFVALLAAGTSDTAIARQLNISVRTVGRKVQRLLADVNAATRFQAGVAIGMSRALPLATTVSQVRS